MKNKIVAWTFALVALFSFASPVLAQTDSAAADLQAATQQGTQQAPIAAPVSSNTYFLGSIQSVGSSDPAVSPGALVTDSTQHVTVKLDTAAGQVVDATFDDNPSTTADDVHIGDRVVVLQTNDLGTGMTYVVTDHFRLNAIIAIAVLFLVLTVLLGGKRGFTSVIGLAFSFAVLMFYTIPQISHGVPPFQVAIISTFVIAIVSLTVAHGFSRQTGIALVSTLLTLIVSLGLSEACVQGAHLMGLGSEEAFELQFAGLSNIDLRGLLLAGIVIGVLGILDDVTTTQVATVCAVAEASNHATFRQLFTKGLKVGREHIASLVNTLALAYAGVSLPLLLGLSLNAGGLPIWTLMNSEVIAEELVRTLVGSIALVLAVPISTFAAAWYYSKHAPTAEEAAHAHSHSHGHTH